VVVEIDELRISIDGWREDDQSRLRAREMAVELSAGHLRSGTDVVIPQYLGRTDFIDELERTAHAAGAQFIEVYLVADENEVVARFKARRAAIASVAHPQYEVEDVRAAVSDAIARLDVIATERSDADTVTAHGDPAVTLARLSTILDS
jgi:leucyl aminopeptidase (aminopeptidase T)